MTTLGKDIAVDLQNRVGTVEIRRPPNNFFDKALIAQIGDAFDAFDRDEACRAIVLAAEGKAFCAGADFANRPATGAALRRSGHATQPRAARSDSSLCHPHST